MISDLNERQLALDPSQSFIVQAPAGSGKTELLSQRVLTLLSLVKKPENILAITFTRKAASEMRHRILQALEAAKLPCPQEAHKQETWKLAKKVLEQDSALNWQLLENPQRLCVQTIDAFCAYLTQKLPVASTLGGQLNISEHAEELYQQAIRNLLEYFAKQKSDPDFANLMLHLDNNWLRLENLLMTMIAKRDHWLRFLSYIPQPQLLRQHLEQSLAQLNLDIILELDQHLDELNIKEELLVLLNYAAQYLPAESMMHAWYNQTFFPHPDLSEINLWLTLANFFLTQEGSVRKSIDKRAGFPAESDNKEEKAYFKTMKQRMLGLLEAISTHPAIIENLSQLAILPPLTYSEQQWQIILSLFNVLPLALEYLHKTFNTKSKIDFTEIALRALSALGAEDDPTDLALYLDYQIQHILIDEFQDTSLIQMGLLNKLTANWHTGEHKTLFLVGDPMQSIYRFRNAEVSLFLQTRQIKKINHIELNSLALSSNFRSSKEVITWINKQFTTIFPAYEDLNIAAVPYSSAHAMRQYNDTEITSNLHFNIKKDEVKFIIEKIQHLQKNYPQDSIAILTQTRSQVREIIHALHENHMAFQGVELSRLNQQLHIRDLFALTRALLYLYDRIAWLAILRAPWCGLTLADLHILAQNPEQETLWQRMKNNEVMQQLTPDGQTRLQHARNCLEAALNAKNHKSFAAIVEDTWLDLGGLLCLQNNNQANDCETFFRLLRKLSSQYDALDLTILENQLNNLFAEEHNEHVNLQIMTIHKAKGLEFDHVILPALEKASRSNDSQILLWSERQNHQQQTDLILAPIKASDEAEDKIYNYLTHLEKERLAQEKRRLFYVACTRAKKTLHLTASQPGTKTLHKDCFLHYLQESGLYKINAEITPLNEEIEPVITDRQLARLSLSQIKEQKAKQLNLVGHNIIEPYQWQSNLERKFGTVFHTILFQLAETNSLLTAEFLANDEKKSQWQNLLRQHYFPEHAINSAIEKIILGLNNIFSDEKGRWILAEKSHHKNEFALSGSLENIVIDRLFVDNDEQLWIIDYKTSHPIDEPLEIFLEKEKLTYQPQLDKYMHIIAKHYNKKPRAGLYFPFIPTWIEL